MQTPACEMFGIDVPIFGFSHCRDVVAAISAAGGLGVLGAGAFSPEQLDIELKWLEEKLQGKPYGVDVIMADQRTEGTSQEIADRIPESHRQFVQTLEEELQIPSLHAGATPVPMFRNIGRLSTHAWARDQLDVIWSHSPKLLVSALGAAPADVVAKCRGLGIKVGGMTGSARHAQKHLQVGADLLIAAGNEGAGHNSNLSTMVLVPEVVDVAGDVPVLAAGGIANGRQMAAGLALGAQGVWMGSAWLASAESDLDDGSVDRILNAGSDETVRTLAWSGKPTRFLRTAFFDAWEREDAPRPLGTPMQRMLVAPTFERIRTAKLSHLEGIPLGQVCGQIRTRRSVRHIMMDLQQDYLAAMERLAGLQSME